MYPWSHLPNAVHIDRILEGVKTRHEVWDAALTIVQEEYLEDIGSNKLEIIRKEVTDAVYNNIDSVMTLVLSASHEVIVTAYQDARDRYIEQHHGVSYSLTNAWSMAWHAIRILIVYEHAGNFLNTTVDKLRVLHLLGENSIVALLLPVVYAFEYSPMYPGRTVNWRSK